MPDQPPLVAPCPLIDPRQEWATPANGYQIIYADPPWQYRDKCHAGKRGAGYKYDTMSVGEIAALPIREITDPNGCLLAMWWTGPFASEALRVASAWGFALKNATGFTWVKTTTTGKHAFGMGTLTRGNAENCLFATIGKPRRIDAGVSQLIVSQVREHSRKPDEAADRLVRLMGDVPRIELFARRPRDGWHVWGNELTNEAPLLAVQEDEG